MKGEKNIVTNKKAYFQYHIIEKYEAGIVLAGTEVKSLRQGKVSLQDSYAQITKGEAYLVNCHISPYEKGSYYNRDPKRKRKLLLNKSEIKRLIGATQQKGLTLVPTKMYFKGGYAKVELGLAKGKHTYDKRESLKKKEQQREIDRAVRDKGKE
ncbi:MAG: SsrA-binding protein SmpB [Armatimonadota bacterium]